jgi:hypothetical protein
MWGFMVVIYEECTIACSAIIPYIFLMLVIRSTHCIHYLYEYISHMPHMNHLESTITSTNVQMQWRNSSEEYQQL